MPDWRDPEHWLGVLEAALKGLEEAEKDIKAGYPRIAQLRMRDIAGELDWLLLDLRDAKRRDVYDVVKQAMYALLDYKIEEARRRLLSAVELVKRAGNTDG